MSEHQIDKKRRSIFTAAVASALVLMVGCATQSKKQDPIQVDVSEVTDVSSLIAAIKKSGGSLLSATIPDETFYKEFANSFVNNARAAAELGYSIPKWVLDKLPPQRKVVLPLLGVAMFMFGGVAFAVPVSTVIIAVLASIVLLGSAIISAISALFSSNPVYQV